MIFSVSPSNFFPPSKLLEENVENKWVKEHHPDLYRFLQKNSLLNAYQIFQWGFEGLYKRDPLILFEKEMRSWSEIQAILFPKGFCDYSMPHGYIFTEFEGITKRDQIHWKSLRPLWKDRIDPRPGKLFIELVTVGGVLSRHAYVNFIDRSCNVYQVGLCGKVLPFLPFRTQKGKLASYDPWAFKVSDLRRTRFEVTEEQFLKALKKVERDQRDKNVIFNMLTRNCSKYVTEVAKEIGIDIQVNEYPEQILLRTICNRVGIYPPKWVLKIVHIIGVALRILLLPIYGIALLVLGSRYTEKSAKDLIASHQHLWEKVPRLPLQSISEFIKCRDLSVSTGWKLLEFQEWIRSCREATYEHILLEYQLRINQGKLTTEEEQKLENQLYNAMYGPLPKDEDLGLAMRPKGELILN